MREPAGLINLRFTSSASEIAGAFEHATLDEVSAYTST